MPKKKQKVMTEEVRQFLNKQTCGTDTQGAGEKHTFKDLWWTLAIFLVLK